MTVIRTLQILLFLLIANVVSTFAQSGISLYHLNNATFQGNNFNASFIPNGKVFLGLPMISGIGLDVNTRASYNDLTTTDETGQTILDYKGIAATSKEKNYIGLEAELSTFYIGFKPKSTTAITLFIRERVAARGYYTEDVMNLAAYGDKRYVGEDINLTGTAIDARYYREYGIGFWKDMPEQKFQYGVRLKFLNGMASVITDNELSGTVGIGTDYDHSFDIEKGVVNTSGLNVINSDELTSHLISNGNLGAGIDIGANWAINEYVSAAISVNDLGFIHWKVDPENYALQDTTFSFVGVDLTNIDDFEKAFEDSLTNRFVDTTYVKSYTSGLNTTAYGSVTYNLSSSDKVTATIGTSVVSGNFRMQYALGYTKKLGDIFSISANAIRTPQQGFDLGIAYALDLGAVQLYMASDKLIKVWNVPETSSIDFRFGINFIFGKTKEVKDDRNDLQHPSPYSKGEKIEKSDGIYYKIPLQKPRPVYNDDPQFSGK
ncbi:MAG: DUF5723 family protein [Reichenbachiella sp.]